MFLALVMSVGSADRYAPARPRRRNHQAAAAIRGRRCQSLPTVLSGLVLCLRLSSLS